MDWPNSRIMKHNTNLETVNFKGVKDQAYPLNMAASLMWLMDMYSRMAEVQEARVSRPTCREEQAHHTRLHAGPLSVIDLFSSFR